MRILKYNQMINESKEEGMLFRTNIDKEDVDLELPKDNDKDIMINSCQVIWDYEIVNREYGIAHIHIFIKEVLLEYEYTEYDDNDELIDTVFESKKFDYSNSDIDFEFDDKVSIPLYPQEIEIDLKEDKPKIEIEF